MTSSNLHAAPQQHYFHLVTISCFDRHLLSPKCLAACLQFNNKWTEISINENWKDQSHFCFGQFPSWHGHYSHFTELYFKQSLWNVRMIHFCIIVKTDFIASTNFCFNASTVETLNCSFVTATDIQKGSYFESHFYVTLGLRRHETADAGNYWKKQSAGGICGLSSIRAEK